MQIDQDKLQNFMGRMVGEFGAVASAPLILLGDRLGLYKAMAEQGPMTSSQLAERAEVTERYVREWLAAQAASGFVRFDAATNTYELEDEQAMCFADETSPVFIPGIFSVCRTMFRDLHKLERHFRTGLGVGWHQHDHFVVSGYGNVFSDRAMRRIWSVHGLPALEGVQCETPRPRRPGSRRRLRTWRVDCPDGAGLSGCDIRRLRLSRTVDPARARSGGAGRRRRSHDVRSRGGEGLSGERFRSRCVFSIACMTWRPDRCGGARACVAEGGWHVADRRAVRKRPHRRQSQSGWTDLLFGVDDDLHPGVVRPGRQDGGWARRRARRGSGRWYRRVVSRGFAGLPMTPFNLVLEARP